MDLDLEARYEVAMEIITRIIAFSIRDGFHGEDPAMKEILNDEKWLKTCDPEAIEYIIKKYGPIVKNGGLDG